jgi:hypothetical protein
MARESEEGPTALRCCVDPLWCDYQTSQYDKPLELSRGLVWQMRMEKRASQF